jgi:hypothetical protein
VPVVKSNCLAACKFNAAALLGLGNSTALKTSFEPTRFGVFRM